MSEHFAHADFGQMRQFSGRLFQFGNVRQLAQCNACHFVTFPAAEAAKIARGDIIFDHLVQRGHHLSAASAAGANFRL